MYSALQIGTHHINHCEDFCYFGEINDHLVCAVMDGCTFGNDSYFIATLTGKLLRKITRELHHLSLISDKFQEKSCDHILKDVLEKLFLELKDLRSRIYLDREELLTTLILAIIDKNNQTGCVIVLGDGFICCNGKQYEFDQDNKPDYLGYHLHKNFEEWFFEQHQIMYLNEIRDFTIATDGILTFDNIKMVPIKETIDYIHFLTVDTSLEQRDEMLSIKLRTLEHQYGLKPTDDLALIRLIF